MSLADPKVIERNILTRGQKEKMIQSKLQEIFGTQATVKKDYYNKNSAPVDNFSFYSQAQEDEIQGKQQDSVLLEQERASEEFISEFNQQQKNRKALTELLDGIGIKKSSF